MLREFSYKFFLLAKFYSSSDESEDYQDAVLLYFIIFLNFTLMNYLPPFCIIQTGAQLRYAVAAHGRLSAMES